MSTSASPSPSYQKRLQSYQHWPAQSQQMPEQLAAAGFVYEGSADRVRCPSCQLRLYDWVPCDPLQQHAKFSDCKCELYREILRLRHGRMHGDSVSALREVGSARSRREHPGRSSSRQAYPNGQVNNTLIEQAGLNGISNRYPSPNHNGGELGRRLRQNTSHSDVHSDRRGRSQPPAPEPIRFSTECQDLEPSSDEALPLATPHSNHSFTSGERLVESAAPLASLAQDTAARTWPQGLDSALLDWPTIQAMLRHGVDKNKMRLVIRNRLDTGRDVIADLAGVMKDVSEM